MLKISSSTQRGRTIPAAAIFVVVLCGFLEKIVVTALSHRVGSGQVQSGDGNDSAPSLTNEPANQPPFVDNGFTIFNGAVIELPEGYEWKGTASGGRSPVIPFDLPDDDILKPFAGELMERFETNDTIIPSITLTFTSEQTDSVKSRLERNPFTSFTITDVKVTVPVKWDREEKKKFRDLLDDKLEIDKLEISTDAEVHKFLCPIAHEVMSDPVTATDGHTYERQKIEGWINFNSETTSPLTRQPIARNVQPNEKLKSEIADWLESKLQGNLDVQSLLEHFPDSKALLKLSCAGVRNINRVGDSDVTNVLDLMKQLEAQDGEVTIHGVQGTDKVDVHCRQTGASWEFSAEIPTRFQVLSQFQRVVNKYFRFCSFFQPEDDSMNPSSCQLFVDDTRISPHTVRGTHASVVHFEGAASTTTEEQIAQFAIAGAEIILMKDIFRPYALHNLAPNFNHETYDVDDFGGRLYWFGSDFSSGNACRAGDRARIIVPSGASYMSNGQNIQAENYYIAKMKTGDAAGQCVKITPDLFKVRLPALRESSLPLSKVPEWLGYRLQYASVGCSRYAVNDVIAVSLGHLSHVNPFHFKSQEDVVRFCMHDTESDASSSKSLKDWKEKHSFEWSSPPLLYDEIIDGGHMLHYEALEKTIHDLSFGILSLQPVFDRDKSREDAWLDFINFRGKHSRDEAHVVLSTCPAEIAHWNMSYFQPHDEASPLASKWYDVDHSESVTMCPRDTLRPGIWDDEVWLQVVSKPCAAAQSRGGGATCDLRFFLHVVDMVLLDVYGADGSLFVNGVPLSIKGVNWFGCESLGCEPAPLAIAC